MWYFLIPKLGGGLRPIGLLPSVVRLWERLRRPMITNWMQQQSRRYDWAAVGKTAEAAAWHQLVMSEGVDATCDDPSALAVTTVLLDLVKCSEKVQLMHVWRWGLYWGVPSGLLKLILQVFSFQRALVVEGSHSRLLHTINAIVPGSVFSCAVLHIVLIWPCDRLLILFPSIQLGKYVDDLAVSVKGSCHRAADTAVEATRCLIDMLEDDLAMEVSRTTWGAQGQLGKSVFLCSHARMRQRMCRHMAGMGIRYSTRERYLGVDCYGCGRGRGTSTRAQRMATLRTRVRRLRALKRQGAKVREVMAAGVKPSTLYGCRALGLSDTHVQALRRAVSNCYLENTRAVQQHYDWP